MTLPVASMSPRSVGRSVGIDDVVERVATGTSLAVPRTTKGSRLDTVGSPPLVSLVKGRRQAAAGDVVERLGCRTADVAPSADRPATGRQHAAEPAGRHPERIQGELGRFLLAFAHRRGRAEQRTGPGDECRGREGAGHRREPDRKQRQHPADGRDRAEKVADQADGIPDVVDADRSGSAPNHESESPNAELVASATVAAAVRASRASSSRRISTRARASVSLSTAASHSDVVTRRPPNHVGRPPPSCQDSRNPCRRSTRPVDRQRVSPTSVSAAISAVGRRHAPTSSVVECRGEAEIGAARASSCASVSRSPKTRSASPASRNAYGHDGRVGPVGRRAAAGTCWPPLPATGHRSDLRRAAAQCAPAPRCHRPTAAAVGSTS